jgi:hypothetical protein
MDCHSSWVSVNTAAMNRCSAVAVLGAGSDGLAVAAGKLGSAVAPASETDGVLVADGEADADVDAAGEPPEDPQPAASTVATVAIRAAVTTRTPELMGPSLRVDQWAPLGPSCPETVRSS